ncbi:MAG TPA: C39 family peptidase [Anaerolineales bacterium]|nr:C39 family peptidase [Anaerolineales bacterium]
MSKTIKTLVIVGSLMIFSGVIYFLPPVQDRLGWRVDFAMAYVRSVLNPIQPLPTALPATSLPMMETTQTVLRATPTQVKSATPSPAVSPTMPPSPTPLPENVQLPSPGYEKQDINNCGPASLAMYLRYYGWEGTQEDIASLLKPFREDRNVNVEELAYYVRTRAGWLNVQYRVGGDLDLLKEFLAAGIPVMIEETFYFDEPFWANDDLWAAHYQLLTGYDDAANQFIGQDSFHGPDLDIPYETLDEYWQAFNRVYILIYLPHQEELVKQILGEQWDADVNREHALQVAQEESRADPENAFAWFNLGTNLMYFERYIEATDAYDNARELGLPQRMLRYQFGPFIAYFHTGQMDDLVALTEYALQITPNAEEAWLWHGWAMYRQGDKLQAEADFRRALEENPNYLDAQYGLDFLQSN